MSGFYISSDYAGVTGGDMAFYYGYEETLGDEWCFVAYKSGKETARIPASQLGTRDHFNVEECLLAGISKWLETIK